MGDEDRGMGYTGLGDRGLTPTEYERRELGDIGTVYSVRPGDLDSGGRHGSRIEEWRY